MRRASIPIVIVLALGALAAGCQQPAVEGEPCHDDVDCAPDLECGSGHTCVPAGTTMGPPMTMVCTPGQLVSCSCSGTPFAGSATCNAAGTGLGPCSCLSSFSCGDGLCRSGDGENCVTCPSDCGASCPRSCPTFNAAIAPYGPSRYYCGPADGFVAAGMRDVNTFWNSAVQACVEGSDLYPMWRNNAVSFIGTGYIYYDPAILPTWSAAGSLLPPVYVFAHETGHEIQGRWGTHTGVSIRDELGADCLGGYFVGWLVCQGRANQSDVMATFSRLCELNQDSPWWAPMSHGMCADRAGALQRGISSYLAGVPPLSGCNF